ncbi:MAG: MSCRAMM family protein, partial [Thermoanaerobaculia bacterium]
HVAGLDNTALMRSITTKNEQGESQNAMIDAGGNFRIEAPSGLVEVTAQYGGRRGNRSSRPVTVDAPAGSERRVDLVFPEQVKLRGAVTRAGAPVGNVTIAFGGSGMESASASTNAEGIYETVIDPGEYDVTISDGQRELPFRQHISVTSEARVDFGIESNAVKITVVDAETAQPLAGATVNVAHGGETHEAGSAVTGADGSTTMEVAAADALTITASLRGYANGVADLAAGSGTPVLLRLVRSPGAIVRLVDRRDGRTLTGYVIARDDAGRVVASKSEFDPDGTVTLALAPGRYRFSGSAEGYGSQTLLAEVPSDEVQIALPRGGSIAIRSASDLRGSARLIQPNGEEYVRCWCNGIARIAIDGHMTIVDRISPGPYTLEVTLGAAKPRTVPITVVEGQTLPVPID